MSVSPKALRAATNSPWLGMDHSGYVREGSSPKIVGRIGGSKSGCYWYQFAARPYDETSVDGFADAGAALAAMNLAYVQRNSRSS